MQSHERTLPPEVRKGRVVFKAARRFTELYDTALGEWTVPRSAEPQDATATGGTARTELKIMHVSADRETAQERVARYAGLTRGSKRADYVNRFELSGDQAADDCPVLGGRHGKHDHDSWGQRMRRAPNADRRHPDADRPAGGPCEKRASLV